MVRYGLITRKEALELVKKHDHLLNPRAVREFCEFLGYSELQFRSIVDKLYNEDLFEKDVLGAWHLKSTYSSQANCFKRSKKVANQFFKIRE